MSRTEYLDAFICLLSRGSGSLSFRDPQEPVNSHTKIVLLKGEPLTYVMALTDLGHLLS